MLSLHAPTSGFHVLYFFVVYLYFDAVDSIAFVSAFRCVNCMIVYHFIHLMLSCLSIYEMHSRYSNVRMREKNWELELDKGFKCIHITPCVLFQLCFRLWRICTIHGCGWYSLILAIRMRKKLFRDSTYRHHSHTVFCTTLYRQSHFAGASPFPYNSSPASR